MATPGGTPSGPITKENYHVRAKARACGEWFVIRNPDGGDSMWWAESAHTPAQWRAWIVWFGSKYIPTKFFKFHGVVSVPTEWPEEFDDACGPSDREWRPQPKSTVGQGKSDRVTAGLKRVQEQVGFPDDRRHGLKNFAGAAAKLAANEALSARADYWKSPMPPLYPPREEPAAEQPEEMDF